MKAVSPSNGPFLCQLSSLFFKEPAHRCPSRFEKEVHVLLSTSKLFTRTRRRKRREGTPSLQKRTLLQLNNYWKETSPPDSKGLAGEPSDSELTQDASLISWHRRSTAMWELNATRSSSQSSRTSATTSLDQSCPMTSMARHSLLCSYSSHPKEVSLVEQELVHHVLTGQPPPHVS